MKFVDVVNTEKPKPETAWGKFKVGYKQGFNDSIYDRNGNVEDVEIAKIVRAFQYMPEERGKFVRSAVDNLRHQRDNLGSPGFYLKPRDIEPNLWVLHRAGNLYTSHVVGKLLQGIREKLAGYGEDSVTWFDKELKRLHKQHRAKDLVGSAKEAVMNEGDNSESR